jgi:hypothetical protein
VQPKATEASQDAVEEPKTKAVTILSSESRSSSESSSSSNDSSSKRANESAKHQDTEVEEDQKSTNSSSSDSSSSSDEETSERANKSAASPGAEVQPENKSITMLSSDSDSSSSDDSSTGKDRPSRSALPKEGGAVPRKRAKVEESFDVSVIPVKAGSISTIGRNKAPTGERMTTRLASRELTSENRKTSSAKRPYSADRGKENAAELMTEAGAAVSHSRVRASTKERYEGGLDWKWPAFITFVSGDGESTDSTDSITWGLLNIAREDLVSHLVQFQMYLNRESLSTNQIKLQWSKTFDRFSTPGAAVNVSLVSDDVWRHPWVSAVRNTNAVDLQGFVSGLDRASKLQLAAGFAVLWQVRKTHFKQGPYSDQETLLAALGYLAIALMFNFGWRPGQLVWTGNAAHLIRRGSLVFGLTDGSVMFRADASYSVWFQERAGAIGVVATLILIKEAWFVIKSSKTTGSDKRQSKRQVNHLETAKIGRETILSTMLLEDLATVCGFMPGDANEGIAVSTGPAEPPSPTTVPLSFIAKGKISQKTGGELKSDKGVAVVVSKTTQTMIKAACNSLGVENKPFTHRLLRKAYATGMNEQARAYADFMAKHTTGGGQWAEGSTTIAKHYITSDIEGMLSLLDDKQSAEEHAAENLVEMKQRIFLNSL